MLICLSYFALPERDRRIAEFEWQGWVMLALEGLLAAVHLGSTVGAPSVNFCIIRPAVYQVRFQKQEVECRLVPLKKRFPLSFRGKLVGGVL